MFVWDYFGADEYKNVNSYMFLYYYILIFFGLLNSSDNDINWSVTLRHASFTKLYRHQPNIFEQTDETKCGSWVRRHLMEEKPEIEWLSSIEEMRFTYVDSQLFMILEL